MFVLAIGLLICLLANIGGGDDTCDDRLFDANMDKLLMSNGRRYPEDQKTLKTFCRYLIFAMKIIKLPS